MSNRRRNDHNRDSRYSKHQRYHRGGNIFFLFDILFSVISLVVTIALNTAGLILDIISSVLDAGGMSRNQNSKKVYKRDTMKNAENRHTVKNDINKNSNSKTSDKTYNNVEQKVNTQKSEKMKKQNTKKKVEEKQSDWNIVIFIFTLIPVIVFLAMEMIMYAGASVLIGIGVMLMYNIARKISKLRSKNAEKRAEERTERGKEENETEKLIKQAFNKVYAIQKNLYRVQNEDIRNKVSRLCDMSEKIIGEVRTNPENIKIVKRFFYYYLDAFNDIFNRYLRIYSFNHSSEEIDKTIKETEKSFDEIENILKELCEDLIESDMMNIKATINVMKNSQ